MEAKRSEVNSGRRTVNARTARSGSSPTIHDFEASALWPHHLITVK